jgi:hypothetical protein
VAFSSRMIEHSVNVIAVEIRNGCPARHPSPKKSPSPNMAITASLPPFERTDILTLPFWM